MNIEEAIKVIKNMKFDLYSGLSCKECIFDNDTKCIKENGEDCQEIAIETLLTAYNDIKTEHKIMKRIIVENGLWERLLNDDEFIKHLEEE